MPTQNLTTLAKLIGDDSHACSFQSLGQYRAALLKAIAQASAAPEQEPVAWLAGKTVWENRSAAVRHAADRMLLVRPLYTHADDGEAERLRAELAESDKCVMRALNERDAALKQLAEAQELLRDFYPGCGLTTRKTAVLRKQADAFLSATAQPDEVKS